MNVLALYMDNANNPRQHILTNQDEDNFTVDGIDLTKLDRYKEGNTVFFVVLDDIKRPTVLDSDSGDEIGAEFGDLQG